MRKYSGKNASEDSDPLVVIPEKKDTFSRERTRISKAE